MKKQKTILYTIVSLVTIIAGLVFLRTAIDATTDSDGSAIQYQAVTVPLVAVLVPLVVPTVIPSSTPVHMSIPTLNISANVQRLGLTKTRSMGTPTNFVDVGWYSLGTIPGNIGSAVIDGHVDNGLSLAGVFKHLADTKNGDDIYVTRHDGTIIHFVVTNVQSFNYKDVPTDTIFNENDGAYLKLITCGGTWVPGERTYDQRIVVTSVLAK